MKKKQIVIIICCVAVLLLGVGGFFTVSYLSEQREQNAILEQQAAEERERLSIINSETFHEGITVNGISVGGMTIDQAKTELKKHETEFDKDATLTLAYQDKSFVIDADNLDFSYDYDKVLTEAKAVGREGDLASLKSLLSDLKTNGKEFKLSATVDASRAQSVIAQAATAINVAATNATVQLNPNATSSADRFNYIPEVNGVSVDETALLSLVQERLTNGEFGTVEVPVTQTPAEVTVESLKTNFVLRASASTSFNSSKYGYANRVHNIEKGVALINGTVIAPGAEFSTNGILGARTTANGWKLAGAYEGGKTAKQAGGGVCQLSSTLYNAIVKADLEITYRQNHSMPVGYVPRGLDATINSIGNIIDFTWKNNTGSDILVVCYTKNRELFFEIYGEAFSTDEYDEIRLSSKKIKTLEPAGATKETVDASKPVGYKEVLIERQSGSLWQSYKSYYKAGKLVKTVNLASSKYSAFAGEILVGPSATPTAPPTSGPTTGPTAAPTTAPTAAPTTAPTAAPTTAP